MKRPTRKSVNRLLAAALAATPLMAGAASGEFTFVVGEVGLTKANGQRSAPVKGTPVDAGDRVTTGANGMAQLTMVDQARLSLRPSTQFQIEAYPERRDSDQGVILNLVKGTLRTFTGLIASTNRDKFVMKTRVATVGIRGSGNILHACEGKECDESISGAAGVEGGVTVNHTIEGSHAVSNIVAEARAGVPAQQGGAATLITGPGQTVMVAGGLPPRYIPLPSFIANQATNMTAAKPAETASATGAAADTRNFSPSDTPALPRAQQATTTMVGNNGLGFVNDIDATANLGADPLRLRDIIIVAGSPFPGQATANQVEAPNNQFRSYTAYAGTQSGIAPAISGGTLRDLQSVIVDAQQITLGRWENAGLGIFGGSGSTFPGSIHWIMAASGYPTYLSDVLTGTATYALVAATAPTNLNNTVGALGSAAINVNFTTRTLGLQAVVTLPVSGANPGGSWQMSADAVPFALNAFFGSTSDRFVVTNGTGQSSRTNTHLTGSFEGSFVGTGLSGAILGYGIADLTGASAAAWNFITGVAAFSGPRQDGGASYREGRISDPAGTLPDFIRSYATTDRPDEIVVDAQGRVTALSAPYSRLGPHASYTIGTAQVVESGFDPETGLVWGRWGGGVAQIARAGQTDQLFLNNASLHYIFAGQQAGPVALPLTGTGVYDVIGSTLPTNSSTGAVGTLNSATLNANFTNRTIDAAVNIGINSQTWTGSASNVPIYRDQYFSSYSGTPIAGVPNPSPLNIGCSPNCGAGATGSIDGFFAGRTGNRAGMMYNLGGNQGAVAFGRRGG